MPQESNTMLEFNGKKLSLKYLYVGHFVDGSVYEQNESDISTIDPTRSCFFDIQELQKEKKLAVFSITDGTKVWSVNLETGVFSVEHGEFALHDTDTPYYNVRLIFFRRRSQDLRTGEEIGCQYVFGWQGNVEPSPESRCDKFTIYVK